MRARHLFRIVSRECSMISTIVNSFLRGGICYVTGQVIPKHTDPESGDFGAHRNLILKILTDLSLQLADVSNTVDFQTAGVLVAKMIGRS